MATIILLICASPAPRPNITFPPIGGFKCRSCASSTRHGMCQSISIFSSHFASIQCLIPLDCNIHSSGQFSEAPRTTKRVAASKHSNKKYRSLSTSGGAAMPSKRSKHEVNMIRACAPLRGVWWPTGGFVGRGLAVPRSAFFCVDEHARSVPFQRRTLKVYTLSLHTMIFVMCTQIGKEDVCCHLFL